MDTSTRQAEVASLERQAIDAMQRGQHNAALGIWARIVALVPQHTVGLTQLGQAAFKRAEFQAALDCFQRAADADGREPRQWINLALAHQRLGHEAEEEAALFKALTVDPCDLLALVLRGSMYERQGRLQLAARAYGAVAAMAPPLDRLLPELRPAVAHAMTFRDQHQAELSAFLDRTLEPHLKEGDAQALERFQLSVDILVGRKRRFDPQPMRYYVPQLPVVEFFDRSLFPWFEAFEAATDAIRDEMQRVLAEDSGAIAPYIEYDADQPVAQWAELNHSPRWSAFHLVKDGQPVAANAARCPQTMAAWHHVPVPDQPGRTPVAMYSLLKPTTRIPPHVGASNARLVVHLPLVVPPGCAFRVGNTVREWVPGRAWAFDDTIEHEAWNDSDQLRAILICDTWHPMLNAEERRLITVLNQALNTFSGAAAADYDV